MLNLNIPDVQIINCLFYNNRAEMNAGVFIAYSQNILIQNSTFIYNSAKSFAGVSILWSCNIQFTNTTIGMNEASFVGSMRFVNTTSEIESTSEINSENNKAYLKFPNTIDFCTYGEFKSGELC